MATMPGMKPFFMKEKQMIDVSSLDSTNYFFSKPLNSNFTSFEATSDTSVINMTGTDGLSIELNTLKYFYLYDNNVEIAKIKDNEFLFICKYNNEIHFITTIQELYQYFQLINLWDEEEEQ